MPVLSRQQDSRQNTLSCSCLLWITYPAYHSLQVQDMKDDLLSAFVVGDLTTDELDDLWEDIKAAQMAPSGGAGDAHSKKLQLADVLDPFRRNALHLAVSEVTEW